MPTPTQNILISSGPAAEVKVFPIRYVSHRCVEELTFRASACTSDRVKPR